VDKVEILYVPVSLRHKEKHIYEGPSSTKDSVHFLSLQSMLNILRKGQPLTETEEKECQLQNQQAKQLSKCKTIPFFQWSKDYNRYLGHEWEKEEQEAHYTGNEAQNGRVDATYICAALIVNKR
jgi:hypothetical protein